MKELEDRIARYLHRYRNEIGAMWTGDIAYALCEDTPPIRRALQRMEKAGLVRRVVIGNPTSWELTEPQR